MVNIENVNFSIYFNSIGFKILEIVLYRIFYSIIIKY